MCGLLEEEEDEDCVLPPAYAFDLAAANHGSGRGTFC